MALKHDTEKFNIVTKTSLAALEDLYFKGCSHLPAAKETQHCSFSFVISFSL